VPNIAGVAAVLKTFSPEGVVSDIYNDRKRLRKLLDTATAPGGMSNIPWDRYYKLVTEYHELVYQMKPTGTHTLLELLTRYPKINKVISQIDDNSGQSVQEVIRILTIHNYVAEGAKDFYLCDDIALLLRDTDIPDIPVDEVKFPFEALSIVFSPGMFDRFGWDKMQRIVLTKPEGGRSVWGFIISDHGDGAPAFNLALGNKDGSLAELLRTALQESEVKGDMVFGDATVGMAPSSIQLHTLRLIFNTMLYVTSSGADVFRDSSFQDNLRAKLAAFPQGKKTRKQKQLEAEYCAFKAKYLYIVGKHIKAEPEYSAQPANEAGRKLLKRSRTRGHWRPVRHGPRHSLSKIKWIKPYWRGPTLAEMINKGYVVK